jgi:endonuclease/exonuclease/phosphatase family metal-dependent hydrolase
VAGQANAILLGPKLRPLGSDSIVLNPRGFRRLQGRQLELEPRIRLAWAKERRVCHAVRCVTDERNLTVANLHDSSVPDWRVPDRELLRASVFAESFAEPGETLVLAGDFNVIRERSETMEQLTSPAWGFSRPISGIDQILVRSASSGHAKRWPDERRRLGGRLLSDHAPVEVTIE